MGDMCHKLPLPPCSPTSPSALPSSEKTPCNLSKWHKGRLLGRGTFGHVYLGLHSGKMCAIKQVRFVSEYQTSRECLKQLNQEINLLSQLSDPNIVQYYGSELGEETLSVYLEYVSGGSIRKLLQEYGAFKEPIIQNYIRQILSGLACLHGRNTVHRDIKGENIQVDPTGEIKLANFGMAKHITACGTMFSSKGSPYWMAPEWISRAWAVLYLKWQHQNHHGVSMKGWLQYLRLDTEKICLRFLITFLMKQKVLLVFACKRDPSARPTTFQLLDHPFIRDHETTRVANPILEMQSKRNNIVSFDGDYGMGGMTTTSRALRNPRYARTVTSLPVSPCSSPLRYCAAHKSCYLSPVHAADLFVGQSGRNLGDFVGNALRPNPRYSQDPWLKTS
ncbi:serine/threonine-protein kinase cst-1-like isoform 2 [Hibiscus syriacus]|uniref:mitogen-activated protein kinase kinase kinase n=1 Tax=Hibiscus syriacus TaxID=106335 RepID=A0A6A2XBZ1_HIBSY|nr:serine/threonine-protein kinase cst-1-like isoform 2 [Hibiscus syriacus]